MALRGQQDSDAFGSYKGELQSAAREGDSSLFLRASLVGGRHRLLISHQLFQLRTVWCEVAGFAVHNDIGQPVGFSLLPVVAGSM